MTRRFKSMAMTVVVAVPLVLAGTVEATAAPLASAPAQSTAAAVTVQTGAVVSGKRSWSYWKRKNAMCTQEAAQVFPSSEDSSAYWGFWAACMQTWKFE